MRQATSSCCLENWPLGENSHLFCLSQGKWGIAAAMAISGLNEKTVYLMLFWWALEPPTTMGSHSVADLYTHSISLS